MPTSSAPGWTAAAPWPDAPPTVAPGPVDPVALGGAAMHEPDPALPGYPVAARPTGRVPFRALSVVLAAFIVLLGSGFAVFALARPDGASTPEDAVRQLFDALDQEDAAGVLEALPPSERDVIKQPVLDILEQLQRLGVLSDVPTEHVPGADIQVRDLSLSEEPVGANEDLKAVRVLGGKLVTRTVPDQVPIGPTLKAVIEQDFGEKIDIDDRSDTEDLAKDDLRLITVKEAGGWHVSLFYSVAEAARDGKGAAPVLGGGPSPVGSDSPEGAVHGLVDGAVALDLQRVITMLPPDEARAAYDYAPLFLPDVDKAAADAKAKGFSLELTNLGTSVEGEGDTRRVKITSFDLKGGDDKSHGEVRWDGSCVVMDSTSIYPSYYSADEWENYGPTTPYDPSAPSTYEPSGSRTSRTHTEHFDSCTKERTYDGETAGSSGGPYGDPFFGELDLFGTVKPDYAFVVVQRDGRWYVSPMRTVFDSILSSLRSLTPEQIRTWAQKVSEQEKELDRRYGSSGSGSSTGRPVPVPGTAIPSTPGTALAPDGGPSTTPTTAPRTTPTNPTRPSTSTTAPRTTTTGAPRSSTIVTAIS
jgi:hypothetical protein